MPTTCTCTLHFLRSGNFVRQQMGNTVFIPLEHKLKKITLAWFSGKGRQLLH